MKYSTYFKIINLSFLPVIILAAVLFNQLIPDTSSKLSNYATYTLFFLLLQVNLLYMAYCGIKLNILPELMGGRQPVIGKGKDVSKTGWAFLVVSILMAIAYLIFTVIYFM